MTLLTTLRDFLGIRPKLRNKRGGLAYITGIRNHALNGRIVVTVHVTHDDYWLIDPPQRVVLSEYRHALSGVLCAPGDLVDVVSISDENLIPIPDAKLSKADVHELFMSGPVRTKETA